MERTRRLQLDIKRLSQLKTWQLLLLLMLAAFITATFLRLNNVGMIERRDAVLSADKAGDVADIARRIVDLQRYSAAHMNADTGRIELVEQYKRDATKLMAAAGGSTNPNGNIYAAADAVCKPQFHGYSIGYQNCYMAELNKHPAAPQLVSQLKMPDAALYRYEFISPLWTADWAGWSVLICLLITLVIVLRLIVLAVLHIMLKRRYRGA